MEHVHLRLPQRFAQVEPVPNQDIKHMTVGTPIRTRKHQSTKTLHVLVDKASKVGYNDHALQPDSKDAVKLTPSSRLFLSPGWTAEHTRFQSKTKRPSRMDGLMNDGGEYL